MTWRDAGRHEVGAAVCGLWVTGCGQGGDAENAPEALRPPEERMHSPGGCGAVVVHQSGSGGGRATREVGCPQWSSTVNGAAVLRGGSAGVL